MYMHQQFMEMMKKGPQQREYVNPEITEENKAYLTPGFVLEETSNSTGQSHDSIISNLLRDHFKLVESPDDKEQKENALLKLNDILRMWMKRINEQLEVTVVDQDPNTSKNYARLLCYGSYKLGVSTPAGDIDTLVLAPNYVDRDLHFFGTLYSMLEDFAKDNDNIKELTSINYEHSITPLIKMKFYNVSVDMVFAKLEDVSALDGQISANGLSIRKNLNNDELMREMDEKMKRSYNGFRNAEMILNSIITETDKKSNDIVKRKIENYRMLLRCIKLLSKNNGINENKFGYLGGIAYALLTAKVFQMYPNYSVGALLERFLFIYAYEWDWETWVVRIVDEILVPGSGQAGANGSNGISASQGQKKGFTPANQNFNLAAQQFYQGYMSGNFPGMNPMMMGVMPTTQPKHLKRYMTVLTPAWPQMNSTHNVTFGTREVILKTFKKKHDDLLKILELEIEGDKDRVSEAWIKWFQPYNFFEDFEEYLQITIVGKEEASYLKWKGFIEAKIRFLCERIEQAMNSYNFEMQIWPFGYDCDQLRIKGEFYPSYGKFPFKEQIFIGLRCLSDYMEPIDLKSYICRFLEQIEGDWRKENPKRNEDELNLFVYLLERDQIDTGKDKEEIPALQKREQVDGLNNWSAFPDLKVPKFNSIFLKTNSSITDTEEPDSEILLDQLLE